MTLTDEEIRIKVAESLKWTGIHKRNSKLQKSENGTRLCGKHPALGGMPMRDGWCNANEVPNYPLDLNACASFEKTLSSSECAAYRDFLHKNPMCYDDMIGACIDWQLVHATARQRCLAYLKTKGILP